MLTKKNFFTLAIGALLLAAIMLNSVGCAIKVQAANLMEGIEPNKVEGKTSDEKFIGATSDFAVKLFKKTVTEGENSLISPLSVMLALAMTANGADNATKTQMEALLGGTKTIDTLNEYLYTYVKSLPSGEKSKLKIANSIWFRDDEYRLTIDRNFLQKNADYYGASVYKSAFDGQTLKDINGWVKQNTDGMINKILDQISDDSVMYLINAIVFDAEWETVYMKNDIYKGVFTNYDGTEQSVEMMSSGESKYINDGKATGFIKNYKNGDYGFAALLPNEGVDVDEYIASLTGEGFVSAIKNAKTASVTAVLPKFSYDYSVLMNEQLKALGMTDAFNSLTADFSKLGKSERGNIYIFEVLHKTFISVDELGTKAGAVTKVEVKDECEIAMDYCVTLDRPFVYAIVDNATGLPIFLGTVMSLG
ncbi:MAG: serpin family protein [Firmicutes bacterium]|nr:serpin family protein [Bacillota bacterium]